MSRTNSHTTDNDDIEMRLIRYDRHLKLCTYLGGAIGGIFVIVGLSSTAIANAPWWLISALITATIISGICLGRAYVGYLSAQYYLVLYQKKKEKYNGKSPFKIPRGKRYEYPSFSHKSFIASCLFLFLSGFMLLAALWFPPVSSDDTQVKSTPPCQGTVPSVPPVVAP